MPRMRSQIHSAGSITRHMVEICTGTDEALHGRAEQRAVQKSCPEAQIACSAGPVLARHSNHCFAAAAARCAVACSHSAKAQQGFAEIVLKTDIH